MLRLVGRIWRRVFQLGRATGVWVGTSRLLPGSSILLVFGAVCFLRLLRVDLSCFRPCRWCLWVCEISVGILRVGLVSRVDVRIPRLFRICGGSLWMPLLLVLVWVTLFVWCLLKKCAYCFGGFDCRWIVVHVEGVGV